LSTCSECEDFFEPTTKHVPGERQLNKVESRLRRAGLSGSTTRRMSLAGIVGADVLRDTTRNVTDTALLLINLSRMRKDNPLRQKIEAAGGRLLRLFLPHYKEKSINNAFKMTATAFI
jgi:hypothetical protein